MKRAVKKAASLVAATAILLAALLTGGCHGSRGADEFAIPESFDTDREYEITFWAKNDTNKTQTAIYEKAIDDFETLYPNISVKLRLYTDYGKIYNDVITNIATNTTPNVCITYPDHIATYLTGKNTVVPLDELMADESYGLGGSGLRFDSPGADEIIPKFLEECSFEGHCYALPYMRSTEACYVNKTYVEALGYTLPETLTWDFVWEVAEAAAKKDGNGTYLLNGQKVMIPVIYKSTDNMMITMLFERGAGYSTEEGEILLFNDTAREILETVAEHAGSGAFSTFRISGYPANFLNAGQCVFAIDSTAGATWMGSDAPLSDISADRIVSFETAVMTVPQFDADDPRMISQGPSICIFNKSDSGEVLASWLFAQYLLSDGVQTAYAETEGYIPVTTCARDSEEYQTYLSLEGADSGAHYGVKIRAARLLLDNIDNTFVTPVFNGSASLRDAAGQLVENVTKSVRRGETADRAYLDGLFEDVSSLYRLNALTSGAGVSGDDGENGKLPAASAALLSALALAWLMIGLYVILRAVKKKKDMG